MWTTKIIKKDFEGAVLRVIVEYSNGTRTFQEEYRVYTVSVLDSTINAQITRLQDLDAFEATLPLGTYTPTPTPAPDPLGAKISELNEYKRLISLGVINESDPDYQTALQAAKSEYSKT